MKPTQEVTPRMSKPGTLFVQDEATGEYRRARPKEIVQAAESAIHILFHQGTQMNHVQAARQFLSTQLATREREVFACLFLNTKHRVLQYEELFFGTIDSAAVYPREVVKRALHHNAAVILAHNHPSGDPEPSRADQVITARLQEVLRLVEVRVLDHLVIGGTQAVSLAERGML
jgi:DNA repair protein RadC